MMKIHEYLIFNYNLLFLIFITLKYNNKIMAFVSETDRGLNNLNINYTKLGPGYYIGQDIYNYTSN